MLTLSLGKCLALLHVIYSSSQLPESNDFIHYSSMKLHCMYIHALLNVFKHDIAIIAIVTQPHFWFPTTSLIVSSIAHPHQRLLSQIFLMVAVPTPSHSVALIVIINVWMRGYRSSRDKTSCFDF